MQEASNSNLILLIGAMLIAICVFTILSLQSKATHPPIVLTECGPVEGKSFNVIADNGREVTVNEFLNIPYGASPTNELRWKAPVSRKNNGECWSGTLKYRTRFIKCMQFANVTENPIGQEDCLILNVQTPQHNGKKKLPVLVWIHGGGMIKFHSREPGYSPTPQFSATMEVVSVSINYRLNVFGFLSLRELWDNQTSGEFGNYGILDQILALKWVKNNIANFGGDPNQVTAFGQSGGGTATYCLISASLGPAKGLFKKIIASSGAPNIQNTYIQADRHFRVFINDTNCSRSNSYDVQRCLRKLDAVTALSNYPLYKDGTNVYSWNFPVNEPKKGDPIQVIDPLVVQFSPRQLLEVLRTRYEPHNIDIMMGFTSQEPMRPFIPKLSNWSDWKDLKKFLRPKVNTFSKKIYSKLIKQYRKRSPNKTMPSVVSPFYVYTTMLSDILLGCSTSDLAAHFTHYNPFKVYTYVASQPLSSMDGQRQYPQHSCDINTLFGLDRYKILHPSYVPSKGDKKLETNLRSVYKRFIYSEKEFETLHRNKTIEFWNDKIITWKNRYHETECNILRKYGFLKFAWGNLGLK